MTVEDADYAFIKDFLNRRCAIALAPGKEYLIESRLATVIRAQHLGSFEELLAELRVRPDSPIAQAVVDAMTTNETSFFRDIRPFDALRTELIPMMLTRRAMTRTLRIWSAASSTGQEAFSVAILLKEHFPELAGWRCSIVGTDISSEVIAKAQSARYSALEIGRGMSTSLLVKYFEQSGTHFQVMKPVRDLVTFQSLNLAGPLTDITRPDIVLLRNVLIYFDVSTREKILRNVADRMADDGILMLGGGETILGLDVPFEKVETPDTNYLIPKRVGAPRPTSQSAVRPAVSATGRAATRV